MKKPTEVSKLTRTTRAPSEESHFANINDAIEFGNGHIDMFNQMQAAAYRCRRDMVRDVPFEKRSAIDPGNAYAMVVKFLDEYSKKIDEYNNLPFRTDVDKAMKEKAARELEAMLYAFQDEIKEKASMFVPTRAKHSKDLYNNLMKVFDARLIVANITAYTKKVAKGIEHALSPATWKEKIKSWGEEKITLAQLPAIPGWKSIVPIKTLTQRTAEEITAAAQKFVSMIMPHKSGLRKQNSNNNNNVKRESSREALSVVITALGGNAEVLKKLAEQEQAESGRDRVVEPDADFIVEGGVDHPLFNDLDAYNNKKKSKVSPESTKGQERQTKAQIAKAIEGTLQIIFPKDDMQLTYEEAIAELSEALTAIKYIKENQAELLSRSDLNDMLDELKDLCDARLKEYEAGKKQKDQLDLKFKKPSIDDVFNNNQGAIEGLKEKFDKNNLTEKDKVILSYIAVANGIVPYLPEGDEHKAIRDAYLVYFSAIVHLMDKPRTDEHDVEWQAAAKAVNDAYVVMRNVVNAYNEFAGGDRAVMIPMHDVLPTPAPIASVVAGQRVHNPMEFMNQHNLVMASMMNTMEKAKPAIKELAGYKAINEALKNYQEALAKLMDKYDDRNRAIAVEKAYVALENAVDVAQKPTKNLAGQVQQPPGDLVLFVQNYAKSAMLYDGKPPVEVFAEEAEVRRESVKKSAPSTPPAAAQSVNINPIEEDPRERVKEKFENKLRGESIEVDTTPKGIFAYKHEQLIQAMKKDYDLREVYMKKPNGEYSVQNVPAYNVLRDKLDNYAKLLSELKVIKESVTPDAEPWAVYDADRAWQAKAVEVMKAFEEVKVAAKPLKYEAQIDVKLPEAVPEPSMPSPQKIKEEKAEQEKLYQEAVKNESQIIFDKAANDFAQSMRKGLGVIGNLVKEYAHQKNNPDYQEIKKHYDALVEAVYSPDHDDKNPVVREKAAKNVVERYGKLQELAKMKGGSYYGFDANVKAMKAMCNEILKGMEKNPLAAPPTEKAAQDSAEQKVVKPDSTGTNRSPQMKNK